MTLFYRYPNAITDIVCGVVVTGDYVNIDDAYDAPNATKESDTVVLDGNDTTYSGDSWQCTFANMASFGTTINSVTLCCRMKVNQDNAVTFGLMVSGSHYYDTTATGANTWENYTKVFATNPYTTAAWQLSELSGLKARFTDPCSSLGYDLCCSVYLIVDASPPNPRALNVARQLATGDLRFKRRPQTSGTLSGNLDLIASSPGGLLDVEHVAGPHATDDGWGSPTWKRRTFEIRGLTINPGSGTVEADMLDLHDTACSVWFPAYSTKASGVMEDGIGRMCTPGATWSFTRASDQTITNPVGDSETVTTDVPAYTSNGLALLTAAGGLAGCRAYWTNNTGFRTWPAAQGHAECEIYLAAVSGSANQTIFYVYHDASNYVKVYWKGASGVWALDARCGGVTYSATAAASPTANTTYQIGVRWTGAQAELDLTAYTYSLWVNRVQVASVVAAALTEAGTSTLDIGMAGATNTEPLNGYIRKIAIGPVVLNNTEMARTL